MKLFDMRYLKFAGIKKRPDAIWRKHYNYRDFELHVPDISVYRFLKKRIRKYKYINNIAINYFGQKKTYRDFLRDINVCAKAFKKLRVKKGDVVTILSANIPEALVSFYALSKIGAVANMLHPLLSENEIKNALCEYSTTVVVAMDICLEKINNIIHDTKVYKVVVMSAKDSMSFGMGLAYQITQGFKIKKPKNTKNNGLYIKWKDFYKIGLFAKYKDVEEFGFRDDPCAILQSGGSTGVPKGIVLSNRNFNASTLSAVSAYPDLCSDDKILGIMPIFHGFGLQVSINDALCVGAEIVLIPTFKADEFDKLLVKHNPSVIVGVPTLFEALTKNERMKNVDLSNLKYVIAGGDTLNKKRVDTINQFLKEHGAKTKMIQGYGMTEAVSAVSVDLRENSRPGTIGIPWPGVYVKIVKPGTEDELPYGEDGEICICGDIVMLGYYNNEKETNEVLRLHSDGNIWLHSGDIGSMSDDGFISYKQRLKRMIISSGYNVYPSQIEEVLESHEAVMYASVIGEPHPYKVEVPKAYVVLKRGYINQEKIQSELMELCKKNLAKYAIPKTIEFRQALPKTIVGKVDFRKLQEENDREREMKYGKK